MYMVQVRASGSYTYTDSAYIAKCTSAFEQSHEKSCSKTCSQDFRLGSTQTRLLRNIIYMYVASLLFCVFIIHMYQNRFCQRSAQEKMVKYHK